MDDIVVTVTRRVDNVVIDYTRTCCEETLDELIDCEHLTPGHVLDIRLTRDSKAVSLLGPE